MDLKYLNQYPNFKEIVSKVVEKSHLQKKKILNFQKKLITLTLIKQKNFH